MGPVVFKATGLFLFFIFINIITSKELTMKKVVRKVADTLRKLSPLFGSAGDLANVIEEYGLFNGIVYDDGNGWEYDVCVLPNPFSYAVQGWNCPRLAAVLNSDNSWTCSIGYGIHCIWLTFDEDGDVINISPDDIESNRCWGTDDYDERIDIVRHYLERE